MGKSKNKEVAISGGNAEPQEERGQWASPVEFILSCLGYAVGLGNVWRFPYMCYENGGGAFLIPYFIMLVVVGIPAFMIELSIGQYSGSGPMNVWEASPIFTGIGAGMVIISFIGCIYYNMIIAWSLYYMFASWQSVLPWSTCTDDYNSEYCYSKLEASDCETANGTWFNQTCQNSTDLNLINPGDYNCSLLDKATKETSYYDCSYSEYFSQLLTDKRVLAAEEYFNFGLLGRSETIEETGTLKWDLVLVLLLAWIMCFLCVIKGIKSTGKVVYFTATFPYLVLVILFFRGITLEGALDGIKFYIIPDWQKLLTAKVWADAAGQIFFSLSVGSGGLMTFASYNKFHNNVYRDTLIVAIGNCLTSFFAGFVIFSILGYMAHTLGTTVDKVAASGSGLAFIAYPDVVTHLPVGQLWATLFFFMLLTLGLDSQFAGLENIMTAIVDNFPSLRPKKTFVALALSIIMFLVGLTMCTHSGVYWVELMSYYSSGLSLVLMGCAEAIVFAWVYGTKRLMADIEYMVGFKLMMHWWVMWTIITPLVILAILVFNMIEFTPLSYGTYLLPPWSQALGWLMAISSVAMIPIVAVIKICQSYGKEEFEGLHFGQRLKKLTEPTPLWLPSIEKYGKKSTDEEAVTNGKAGGEDSPPPPYTVPMPQTYDNPTFFDGEQSKL